MTNKYLIHSLLKIKSEVTQLGSHFLSSKTPIRIDDMLELLEPFADLEKSFDRAINKFKKQIDNEV